MKNKKIKSGVLVAIGGVIIAGVGNVQAPGSTQTVLSKGVADSINLENRLKELAALPPREHRMIVTCYTVDVTLDKGEYTCPVCNTLNELYVGGINFLHRITEIIEEIKVQGHDVMLDKSQYCSECSKKRIKYPAPVFKIRFSKNSKYHEVETNNISDYICLLAFLQDRRLYKDCYNIEEYLPEQIEVIKKMTGLGRDLVIK